MGTGAVLTKVGFNTIMNRAYKASPTYSALRTFKLGTGTNTPVITNTDLQIQLDYWANSTKGGLGYDQKPFQGLSPSFNLINKSVTTTGLVGVVDAIGSTVTETGASNLYCASGTGDLCSRIVFTGIAKVIGKQIMIQTTYKRG